MTDALHRRRLLIAGMAALAAPALVGRAEAQQFIGEIEMESQPRVRRNVMSFRHHRWQDHFQNLRRHAILCDTDSRALYFWHEDGVTTRIYPTSVPMSDEFRRLGFTTIVAKRVNPTWVPTPNMRQRDPTLPLRVGPGPENPLGTRAMNLGWQFYLIHGIDDVAKIGRRASNGCIGLFNHHVEELFEWAMIGTQVRVIGSVGS